MFNIERVQIQAKLRLLEQKLTVSPDDGITIFAPSWVQNELKNIFSILALGEVQLKIIDPEGKISTEQPLSSEGLLTQLISIARNESINTSGKIAFQQYGGIDRSIIYALKDLVRHCVIVGRVKAIAYGGYGGSKAEKFPQGKNPNVYVCDLSGLQFQEIYNTGRLVLIGEELPQGMLDNAIYKNTVGEEKIKYSEAGKNKARYIPAVFKGAPVFFDTKAYEAFVAQDFLLAAEALNEQALVHKDEINFKFLKYGAGFFAEGLDLKTRTGIIPLHLVRGVKQGLLSLLQLPLEQRNQIKRIELPFYLAGNHPDYQGLILKEIEEIKIICQKNGIEFDTSNNDALKPTSHYITATTNCSDPHVVTGNEMGYNSVDAAIAYNLEGKANQFNPILNNKMSMEYLNVPHLKKIGKPSSPLTFSSPIPNKKEETSKPEKATLYSASSTSREDRRLAIKFESKEACDAFLQDFLKEAKSLGFNDQKFGSEFFTKVLSPGYENILYIEPSKGPGTYGVYETPSAELAINFGNTKLRDYFAKILNLTDRHALMPLANEKRGNALYFKKRILPPQPDGKTHIETPYRSQQKVINKPPTSK